MNGTKWEESLMSAVRSLTRQTNNDYDAFAAYLDLAWGFVSINGTAPLWVGEFGTCNSAYEVNHLMSTAAHATQH